MYTYDTSKLVVIACGYGTQTIIPGILDLQNVIMILCYLLFVFMM